MAPTSWNDGPLLAGPVRAYKDNACEQIVIETTKFNPAGSGLEVCRLEFGRASEARAILALADLLNGAEPFAKLGRVLADADAEAPLITHPALKLEITVGDMQRMAAACARVFPPPEAVQPRARIKRGQKRKFRP
jgi:hypothetical protein